MTSEQIAENLIWPLWQCLPKDFKAKYRFNNEAWDIYSSRIKSSASAPTLPQFIEKLKRYTNFSIKRAHRESILGVLKSGEDSDILRMLRRETSYVILLAHSIEEKRNADKNEARARDLQLDLDIENEEFDALLNGFGGDYFKLIQSLQTRKKDANVRI